VKDACKVGSLCPNCHTPCNHTHCWLPPHVLSKPCCCGNIPLFLYRFTTWLDWLCGCSSVLQLHINTYALQARLFALLLPQHRHVVERSWHQSSHTHMHVARARIMCTPAHAHMHRHTCMRAMLYTPCLHTTTMTAMTPSSPRHAYQHAPALSYLVAHACQ
jgi:hypothetical protein